MSKLSAVDEEYNKVLGDKLALIEELRHSLESENISCPGVVVAGNQSAGKSSVMEALTGIAFPRAANTCTRVPTIVQLQRGHGPMKILVSTNAEFEDFNTKHASDPNSIGVLLVDAQKMLVEDKAVADKPVHVRFSRPSGPVMTLIDLPGITHYDVSGQDIHKQTSDMVRKYIKNEDMIVLVVIPSSEDFGNTEALDMVKKEAGAEARCIGVVTKCDLVPNELGKTDILQRLRAERTSDVRLDLGYIAVRNRAPDEMGLNTAQALALEIELFDTHPVLCELKPHERGYGALTKQIVALQSDMVARWIPNVRKVLKSKIVETKAALHALGTAPVSAAGRRGVLSKVINAVDKSLDARICTRDTSVKELNISARTRDAAIKMRMQVNDKLPKWLSEEYGQELEPLVKETLGYSMSNFLSDPIFRGEICKHFFDNNNLKEAVEVMNAGVYNHAQITFMKLLSTTSECKTWPKLAKVVEETWCAHLDAALVLLEMHNDLTLDAERTQVFTINHYYEETLIAIKAEVKAITEAPPPTTQVLVQAAHQRKLHTAELEERLELDDGPKTPGEMHSVRAVKDALVHLGFIARYATEAKEDAESLSRLDLQVSLHCYAKVLTKRLFDHVAITARHVLVLQPHAKLSEVMQSAISDEVLCRALAEDGAAAQRRNRLEKSLARFTEAQTKLHSFA